MLASRAVVRLFTTQTPKIVSVSGFDRIRTIRHKIAHEAKHYWTGSKLFAADVKISSKLLKRSLQGFPLSRRERRQLIRTTSDVFRLIPFSVFVLVPFAELLLPFAIKFFPNMLPTAFEDVDKKQQELKQQLQRRLTVARVIQDTLKQMSTTLQNKGDDVEYFQDLIDKCRAGLPVDAEDIVKVSQLFKDDITLDNMNRSQLISLCSLMGVPRFGNDFLLRFHLRKKLRDIQKDDLEIMFEGVQSLTVAELQIACAERGMRAHGLSPMGYRKQLEEWLDLACSKKVPASLLLLSRAIGFSRFDEFSEEEKISVADSIASLDDDIVREAIVDHAGSGSADLLINEMKLKSLKLQNEMINRDYQEAAASGLSVVEDDDNAVLSLKEAEELIMGTGNIAIVEANQVKRLLESDKELEIDDLIADVHAGDDDIIVKLRSAFRTLTQKLNADIQIIESGGIQRIKSDILGRVETDILKKMVFEHLKDSHSDESVDMILEELFENLEDQDYMTVELFAKRIEQLALHK